MSFIFPLINLKEFNFQTVLTKCLLESCYTILKLLIGSHIGQHFWYNIHFLISFCYAEVLKCTTINKIEKYILYINILLTFAVFFSQSFLQNKINLFYFENPNQYVKVTPLMASNKSILLSCIHGP